MIHEEDSLQDVVAETKLSDGAPLEGLRHDRDTTTLCVLGWTNKDKGTCHHVIRTEHCSEANQLIQTKELPVWLHQKACLLHLGSQVFHRPKPTGCVSTNYPNGRMWCIFKHSLLNFAAFTEQTLQGGSI